jgi:hypothetical protein
MGRIGRTHTERGDDMGSRARIAALLFTLAPAWAGCGATGPSPGLAGDLHGAERAWQRAGVASYEYAVERLCFCTPEGRGPVRVRVENGVVTQRTYVGSGDPVPGPLAELFPSVEGLFDILAEAIASGAHSVRATYDPDLGVPLDFWIDYSEQVADEELGMRVTEGVQALP